MILRGAATALALPVALAAVTACGPTPPEGVDIERLDAEIGQAIGDPGTCVLIAEREGGDLVHRYGSHRVCGRVLPACEGDATRSADDLLDEVLATGEPVSISCPTAADGSRSVGWAAGPVAGGRFVYAASMESDRALPGLVISDRLAAAFADAGLAAGEP